MTRKLTCIICPLGCELTVIDNQGKLSVTGNTCPRGEKYAKSEYTNPMRTITSTARCSDGSVVSVKTDRPIPKQHLFDCMKMINELLVHLPVSIGDIIKEDVFGSNIIATQNKE